MASDPIPGMESVVASVSGYRGSERENLIKLMTHAGASYIGLLSPSNAFTHMVCRKFEGKRYELAKRMRLIIVNHRWVEDCVKCGRKVSEDPYTLQSGEEVGPLLLEVPVVAKPGLSAMKGKSVSDKSHVVGDCEEAFDPGCGTSRRGVLNVSSLWTEDLFPEVEENNSSQKRKNKSVKTNSKKELQSSGRDCLEDPPLSTSLRMEGFCRHSVKAKRNNPSDIGTGMAVIPRKKGRLVKKNIDSRISVLSDSESDRESHAIRFQSIRNDRVTILSDDSNDELDTGRRIGDEGREGVEVGSNHFSTSKDPNLSVVDGPTAPEGSSEKGHLEVENSEEEFGVRLDSAIKSPSPELSCVICWTEFSTTRGILPCGHRFCYHCIENWADQLGSRRKISTCPLCKASFTAITKVDDAVTSDQNIFSQTIPSAPKVDISFRNYLGTYNFAAQPVSANGCAECHLLGPEELFISCIVCQDRRIHAYCQDPPSNTWTCKDCKDLLSILHRYRHY